MMSRIWHSIHWDPICQLRDHFYFCSCAGIKGCFHEGSSSTGVRDAIHVHSAAHKPHLFGKHETSDLITGYCYRQGSNQGTT